MSDTQQKDTQYNNSMSLQEWIRVVGLQKTEAHYLLKKEYEKTDRPFQIKDIVSKQVDNVLPFKRLETYDSERSRKLEEIIVELTQFHKDLLSIKSIDLDKLKKQLESVLSKTFAEGRSEYLGDIFGGYLTVVF